MEQRIEELEKKIDNLTEQITKGFELTQEQFSTVDKRLCKLEEKIDNLKGNAKSNLETVESTMAKGFADIIAELKKINAVTRYEEQHDDLKRFGQA